MTSLRLTALAAALLTAASAANAQGGMFDLGDILNSAKPAAAKPAAAKPAAATTDSVKVVDITTKDGKDLGVLLKAQYTTARTAGRTPFVELGATWCGPCKDLAASLGDQRMRDAFAGTYIIHIDIDEWKESLAPLGFKTDGIPAFFPINDKGAAIGPKVDGGAWGANTPENMAPPLKKFFTENLIKETTSK